MPKYTDEYKAEVIRKIASMSLSEIHGLTGVPKRTLRDWRAESKKETFDNAPFEVLENPEREIPIEELISHRKRRFKVKHRAEQFNQLIEVKIKIDGPIGIAHFGDPHVDDDGTDINRLFEHVDIVNKTEGLFAGNVGDVQNNWIGRLSALYGEQSTSARDSLRIAEHFIGQVPWLYLVGGNHDVWSGVGDPLEWFMSFQRGPYKHHGVRLNLIFPSGKQVRINSRHNFKGHSMWNTAHGPAKAVQMGWRDHVLTCGHTHVSGYQVLKCPATGIISHALRIASYKTHDSYAQKLSLPDQNIFECPVTIIDPSYEDHDPRLVTTIFDPGEAAEYLTWKRAKHCTRSR